MNISYLDILDRAHNGPYCTEREWDTRVIPGAVTKHLKKYGLERTCDRANLINSDDSLADRFWEAGLDLAVDTGWFCTSTERVIKFSREEILHGLEGVVSYWRGGEGIDAREWKARKPEDSHPPVATMGPLGGNIDEDLFIPVMQSHCQYWPVDATVPGCLTTVYGRELRTGTPYETLGGAHESWLVQEALKRAGRPGMPVLGIATAPSEYGDFGGLGVRGGFSLAQTFVPCLLPAEMKTSYHILQKIAYCLIHHVAIKSGHWTMIGGFAGGPEGCAIIAVAAIISQPFINQATIVFQGILDTRYLGNCGREALWADSVTYQAVSRNTEILFESLINPVSGALTESMLREIAVGALMGTVSGVSTVLGIRTAGGKFPNRTTGLESNYGAEVVKAAAGMTRAEANEIARRLLPKYEDELKRPNIGATFPECFDVKTVKPTKEWQEMYLKIKREVTDLGISFKFKGLEADTLSAP